MERIREQENMRKKVEGYSFKFIHSNWNSKSGSNIYYEFEMKFGVFPEVIFGHAIYSFEAREAKNPMLQTVHKSELKQGKYG